MRFDYFYGMQAEQFAFYQLPVRLVKDPEFTGLAMDAKVLYSMMLARNSLSVKNGWIDDKGRVYIVYSVKEIMADLCCANQKVAKLLAELEQFGLISRNLQGQGKPAQIYVMDFSVGMEKQMFQSKPSEQQNEEDERCEKHMTRDVEITCQEVWKSHANNKEIDIQKEIESSSDQIRQSLLYALGAGSLTQTDRKMYEDIVSLIFDTLKNRSSGVRIHGTLVSAEELKAVLSKVTYDHILSVIQRLASIDPKEIRCKDAYILAILYELCTGKQRGYSCWPAIRQTTGFWSGLHSPRTNYDAVERKLIMDAFKNEPVDCRIDKE